MVLSNSFKLAKLTIAAFKKAERGDGDKHGEPLEVQYNPETLSIRYGNVFNSQASVTGYSRQRSQVLQVALVFDGTSVGRVGGESVATRIGKFLDQCYFIVGDIHEPAFLRLTWSTNLLRPGFDCRLESADINYTSFTRDGSPLHAKLDVVFKEAVAPRKNASKKRCTSPDLSHRRTVKSGDTLPLLCREIYGSATHYLRVAEVNGLDDFRVLAPGRELIFPPFERVGQ